VKQRILPSVLIVDDDPTIRLIAAELLQGGEYAIIEADNGNSAMRIINSVPIELVVLDILMPEMDGLEVIRCVKQSHPYIRILAISAGGRRAGAMSYLETAKVFGADEVMAKPLRLSTFASTVARLLDLPPKPTNPWPVQDGTV
jgi:CheY-like chemotaxis protein